MPVCVRVRVAWSGTWREGWRLRGARAACALSRRVPGVSRETSEQSALTRSVVIQLWTA